MFISRAAAVLFTQVLLFPAMAQAADQKPAAPAPSEQKATAAEPQKTTATYGDWELRCLNTSAGVTSSNGKVCEIAQTVREGQTPMAEIAIGRFNKTDPLRLTAHVAPNIALPSVVKFDYREAHGVTLNWRRCAPVGCFADAFLTDDQAKIFHVQTEPGAINFFNAGGQPVKIPVSFKGLSQAMDALAKE